jgi:hypothetical protein
MDKLSPHPSLLNNNQFVTSVGYFPDNLNPTKSCISCVLSKENSVSFTMVSGVSGASHRTVIQKRAVKRVLDAKVLGQPLKAMIEDARSEKQNKKWEMYRFGDCPPRPRTSLLNKLMALDDAGTPMAFTEVYVDPKKSAVKSNEVVDQWLEILEHPLIPWSLAERRKKFANVYDLLEPYILHYEQEKKKVRKKEKENDE